MEAQQAVEMSFGGVIGEYRHRVPHYLSDYRDAFSRKTIPAALYMFFATFFSTLALGYHISQDTGGLIGVNEYLLMNACAGVSYSLVSCQPLVVLRPTGPITLIITNLHTFAQHSGLPFFPFLAWTGVFVGVFMMVVALTRFSKHINLMSRFTKEVFAVFVCTIYVDDGMSELISTGVGHHGEPGKVVMSVNLAIMVVVAAACLSSATYTRFGTQALRGFIVDYALTISLFFASLVAKQIGDYSYTPYFLTASNQFGPTQADRPWLVDFSALGGHGILMAMVAALPITFFFFMDQNISSSVTQKPEMKLTKGSYYHSSFACMAILNVVGPMFGLPFVTGSLPHSPQFAVALSDIDPHTGLTKYVSENRIAPIIMYALIALPLLQPAVLTILPASAIAATLIFVGLAGVRETQFYERSLLVFTEPRRFPADATYTAVGVCRMHFFTLIQLVCLAATWVLNVYCPFAVSFWIVLLIPFRWYMLPLLFSAEELVSLDCGAEGPRQDVLEGRLSGSHCEGAERRRFTSSFQRP